MLANSASAARAPASWDARYILVSYPLDVVWLLTFFGGRRFRRALERAASADMLLIQGTRDQFTKAEVRARSQSYKAWSDDMRSRFARVTAVDAAGDHFWRGGAMRVLFDTVRSWVST